MSINQSMFTLEYEGPDREYMYSSILCLTSTLDVKLWSTPRPGRFTPRKTRYPSYRRLEWLQGLRGKVTEHLFSTGNWSPDRPARSKTLYRLSYRGPQNLCTPALRYKSQEVGKLTPFMIKNDLIDIQYLSPLKRTNWISITETNGFIVVEGSDTRLSR